MKKEKIILILFFILVIFLGAFYYVKKENNTEQINQLKSVEIREYKGENLSSITDLEKIP